jgi:alpha-tubulin suppressor-like RCC1 family protein
MAIKTNGTLWAWGYNVDGQLSLNDRVARSSPTQVGAGTSWANVFSSGASTRFVVLTN